MVQFDFGGIWREVAGYGRMEAWQRNAQEGTSCSAALTGPKSAVTPTRTGPNPGISARTSAKPLHGLCGGLLRGSRPKRLKLQFKLKSRLPAIKLLHSLSQLIHVAAGACDADHLPNVFD